MHTTSFHVEACMTVNGTGSLLFIDVVTDEKSNTMNSEACRAFIICLDKWFRSHCKCFTVQMDNDPKHTSEPSQGKEVGCSTMTKSITRLESKCISVVENKLTSKHPKSKQDLKTAAVNIWQNTIQKGTPFLVISMGY